MISRKQLIWIVALFAVEIVVCVGAVLQLPDRVPAHWNWSGQVDRYGSRWEFFLVGPPATLLIAGLLIGIGRIPSIGAALARSGAMYGRMAVAIVAALVAIHLVVVLQLVQSISIRGDQAGSPTLVAHLLRGAFVILGILLAVLGNWMGKIRRNRWMGIRTPWTLKSDRVWERTNRLGGRLMMAHGVAVIASALLLPLWMTIAVFVLGVLGLCLGVFVYSRSLFLAEQQPAAGTGQAPR